MITQMKEPYRNEADASPGTLCSLEIPFVQRKTPMSKGNLYTRDICCAGSLLYGNTLVLIGE